MVLKWSWKYRLYYYYTIKYVGSGVGCQSLCKHDDGRKDDGWLF